MCMNTCTLARSHTPCTFPSTRARAHSQLFFYFFCGSIGRFEHLKVIDGKPDSNILVGANNTHLYFGTAAASDKLAVKPLPAKFAAPLVWGYDPLGQPIVGPVSHGKTVFIAVSPSDARKVAITGRASISDNNGKEGIWFTVDGGDNWIDVTGNLVEATKTIALPRPNEMILLDVAAANNTALMVGTVSGIFVTWVGGTLENGAATWSRVGDCSEFPLVLTLGVSYEPGSDTLVAATMGRGIYAKHGITEYLAGMHAGLATGQCN